MNPISFGHTAEEQQKNIHNDEVSPETNSDCECNIFYTPSGDGSYNCSSFSGETKPKAKPSNKKKIAALILLCAVISWTFGFLGASLSYKINDYFSGGYSYPSQEKTEDAVLNIGVNRPSVETTEIDLSDRKLLSVADVTRAVIDSTVEITTETVSYGSFFGDYVREGAGSGVIISDSGYIVTNLHVIENARKINVTLQSGKTYSATVIGADSDTDIAILSISATEKLSPAVFGNSESLAHGEEVVVIGNPLGSLGGSVSNGIVSALERTVTIDNKVMMLIQTNATVNPGNSGGGMFNMYGELIGIINAKSSGDNIEGIGFAIPINSVMNVSTQIIENGYVKGKIDHGLTIIEVEDVWDMTRYNVPSTGIYVHKSEYEKKIQSGDKITELNGFKIESYTDFKKALLNNKVGDNVKIKIQRGQKEYTYELLFENMFRTTQK